MIQQPPLIELRAASKIYERGGQKVTALGKMDLSVNAGEFLSVTGPSGSGKSTLLHLVGCLEQPSSGKILLKGEDVGQFSDREMSRIRARNIGFVFQAFHLLPGLTVLENVLLPLYYQGNAQITDKFNKRAVALLKNLGIMPRSNYFPHELSGGEMQRVAIARALIARPQLLLADEPTGNLDRTTGRGVLDIITSLHQNERMTVLLVTHNQEVACLAQRCIEIVDGRLIIV